MTSDAGDDAALASPGPAAPTPSLWVPALVDAGLLVATLVFFSVVLVVAVLLPGLASLGAAAPPGEVTGLLDESMPAVTIAAIVAMLLTALVVWGVRRKTLGALPAPMPAATAYPLAIVAGILIQAGAQAMFTLLEQFDAQVQTSNAAPLIALAQSAPWLTALMVVAVAPLAEELLFRHVLLRRFALAGRALLGLVLISLLFALMHEPVPDGRSALAWLAGVGLYAGMGVAFGVVYLRTRRLGSAYVAHAVCNLSALALMAYSGP